MNQDGSKSETSSDEGGGGKTFVAYHGCMRAAINRIVFCFFVFLFSDPSSPDAYSTRLSTKNTLGWGMLHFHQGKDSFLPFPRERSTERSASMSTLSSVSSMTDGEISDDNLSVDADCSSGAEHPGAASATIKGGGGGGGGIDQEMGELSELFAPDAFLLCTVLDTEEMEATAEAAVSSTAAAAAAAAATPMRVEPNTEEQVKKSDVALATSPVAVADARVATPPPPPTMVAQSRDTAAESRPEASLVPTVAPVMVKQQMVAAVGNTSAAAAAAAARPNQGCRCGEPACPSLITAARNKRRSEHADGNASLSSITGLPYSLHHHSSRQRKRQRSLAPVLTAPRAVSYECALCKESYQAEIASNPWWSLFRQECPRCHRMQIPRVDATSAAVSVDYIHAVCAEEGEGCDSDGCVCVCYLCCCFITGWERWCTY